MKMESVDSLTMEDLKKCKKVEVKLSNRERCVITHIENKALSKIIGNEASKRKIVTWGRIFMSDEGTKYQHPHYCCFRIEKIRRFKKLILYVVDATTGKDMRIYRHYHDLAEVREIKKWAGEIRVED